MSDPLDLLLKGGTVVTCDDAMRVFVGDVLIRNGRIAGLGPSLTGIPGARAVDARGCIVMPGFVQAHIHLCQVLFRGFAEDLALMDWLKERIWPLEGAHDRDSLRASARLGIAELLLCGTTAALDMGTVQHTDVIFDEARALGLRLTGGKAMMDTGDVRPGGLTETTAQSLRDSDDLCVRYHGDPASLTRYAFAPRFILSCTPELLQQVARLAAARGAMVHTHASENPGELLAVRAVTGKDNVTALADLGIAGPNTLLAHCVHLTAAERASLRDNGTRVAHCPSTNLKLASGTAPIPELWADGVVVGLGADGAPCNNRLSPFVEMRQAALLQKPRLGAAAMPAADVVALATIGGARALGIDGAVGSLVEGKRADVIVVDASKVQHRPRTDPYTTLVYACDGSDVRHVFVDGVWRVRDGHVVGLNLDDVCADAEVQIDAVLARAGLPPRPHRALARG